MQLPSPQRVAYAPQQQQLTPKPLELQDFGKYGVVDQMDKHKLYRAIKQARVQQEQQLSAGLGQYELSGNSGGDLLDLDAHDGDLIEVGGLAPTEPQAAACGALLPPAVGRLRADGAKLFNLGMLSGRCLLSAGPMPTVPGLASS